MIVLSWLVNYKGNQVLLTQVLCQRGRNFHIIWCHDVEIKFIILDLAYQNRVYCTRDVSFLNSFENMLTNEIFWKLVLFWKNKFWFNALI